MRRKRKKKRVEAPYKRKTNCLICGKSYYFSYQAVDAKRNVCKSCKMRWGEELAYQIGEIQADKSRRITLL